METDIKKIAVLTSGGDAPGMNAAIRAVVRTAISCGLEAVGVKRGYAGLLAGDFIPLKAQSVSKTISLGGTFLKSARCLEFKEAEYRKVAYENMKREGIDALVVIGGDGSFRGAKALYEEFKFPVVGVPATIDNDIYGTDYTIGFDTAINTAMDAIDKIRDTADSHNLVFFCEVMGRHNGYIALATGLATGAEATLIPEFNYTEEDLVQYLQFERRSSKTSGIIIVAEGNQYGNATAMAAKIKEAMPDYDTRVTTLGHIQRGGSPTCSDRVLASVLGYNAVMALIEGKSNVMVAMSSNKVAYVPLEDAVNKKASIPANYIRICHIISM